MPVHGSSKILTGGAQYFQFWRKAQILVIIFSGFWFVTSCNPSVNKSPGRGTLSLRIQEELKGIQLQSQTEENFKGTLQLELKQKSSWWSPEKGDFIVHPQVTQAKVILELGSPQFRYRVDYKPRVMRSGKDGAKIDNGWIINDGEHLAEFFDDGHHNYRNLQSREISDIGGSLYRADSQTRFVATELLSGNDSEKASVEDVVIDGLSVVHLRREIITGYGTQVEEWWLDPKRNFALIQYLWAPVETKKPKEVVTRLIRITNLKEIAPEVWYPTELTTEGATKVDGKLGEETYRHEETFENIRLISDPHPSIFNISAKEDLSAKGYQGVDVRSGP